MSRPATFYLGACHATFLARTAAPLFVSYRTLRRRKKFPRAAGRWIQDSGGFTALTIDGCYTDSPRAYADGTRRIAAEVGNLERAAIQDWMCEPHMIARTGLSIAEHQARTVRSYLELRDLAPEIPWMPVLQGWTLDDYVRCVGFYWDAGVDLTAQPRVGVGSVCRRQNTDEIRAVLSAIAALGISVHGFGVKSQGLRRVADVIDSADSMAWSKRAWKIGVPAMPECVGGPHKNCANCLRFALHWRGLLLASLPERWQD